VITKVIFGMPIQTEAITAEVKAASAVNYFCMNQRENEIEFTYKLEEQDIVYGLGETLGRVNKRGRRHISFNTDTADHSESNPSLYSSHNFMIVDGKEHFGVFFDTPAKVLFEVDYEDSGEIKVVCEGKDMVLYQLEGTNSYEITKEFLRAIGCSYIPPLWAFGYGQSRFGYKCEKDFREVLAGYQNAEIPLDYICMDIDYMDRYIDFTVDKERFPDLKAFSAEMLSQGIHLVPIVDAGVKIEPGNDVYEEGIQQGYFCKNAKGTYFQAGVWPGMTHFPDFLNTKARTWFGSKYAFYTENGIEGFWNDMNEPAIFYSENTKGPKKLNLILNMVFGKYRKEKKERDMVRDYQSFYHDMDGKRVRHYDVHNMYGYMMTRASYEGLERLLDHRFLLFVRSSYIGAGRYGGIWTGDNTSCWEHLKLNLRHMPSLNMCGFLYSGADLGGFMGNTTRELLLRWLAVGVFTPLMRNHSGSFTQAQECYQFGNTADFKSIISLRYRLIPYLYSEYMKAALGGDMFIKPVAFVYPEDKVLREIEDQLLVGDSIMIAPIVEEGAVTRQVYLPEAMTMVKYNGKEFACSETSKGWIEIEAQLNEVVFFVRKGKLVPIGKEIQNTSQVDFEDLKLLGDGEFYELYVDDGRTREYSLNNVRILSFVK